MKNENRQAEKKIEDYNNRYHESFIRYFTDENEFDT